MSETIHLHPQYLTDSDGRRSSVMLSVEEFEALIERLEDTLDVQVLREARATATEFRSWKEIEAELLEEKLI